MHHNDRILVRLKAALVLYLLPRKPTICLRVRAVEHIRDVLFLEIVQLLPALHFPDIMHFYALPQCYVGPYVNISLSKAVGCRDVGLRSDQRASM